MGLSPAHRPHRYLIDDATASICRVRHRPTSASMPHPGKSQTSDLGLGSFVSLAKQYIQVQAHATGEAFLRIIQNTETFERELRCLYGIYTFTFRKCLSDKKSSLPRTQQGSNASANERAHPCAQYSTLYPFPPPPLKYSAQPPPSPPSPPAHSAGTPSAPSRTRSRPLSPPLAS